MLDAAAPSYPRYFFLESDRPRFQQHPTDERRSPRRIEAQYAVLLALFLDHARARLGASSLPEAPPFYQNEGRPYGDAVRELRERGAIVNGLRRSGPAELRSSSDLVDALIGKDRLALARAHAAIARIAEHHASRRSVDEAFGVAEQLNELFDAWCEEIERRVGSRLDRKLRRRSRAVPPDVRRPWVDAQCELWLRRLDAPSLLLVTGPEGSGRRTTLRYLRTWQSVEKVMSTDDLDRRETEARSRPDSQAVAVLDALEQPELLADLLHDRESRWPTLRCAAAVDDVDDEVDGEILNLGSADARAELATLAASSYEGPELPDEVRLAHARFLVERSGGRFNAVEDIRHGRDRRRKVLSAVRDDGAQARILRVLAARDDGWLGVDELAEATDVSPAALDEGPTTLRRADAFVLDPLAKFVVAQERPDLVGLGHAAIARTFLDRLARERVFGVGAGAMRDGARHLAQALEFQTNAHDGLAGVESVDIAALLRGDWLSAKWKLCPDELARDLSQLAAALPAGMRGSSAGEGSNALPASFADVVRLVSAATALRPPPKDLWTALHDAAVNHDADADLVAALRGRAVASAGPLVCLLAERDAQHPVAQLWAHEDRGRAALRDLVPLSADTALLLHGDDATAELLDLRTATRRTLDGATGVACAASTGDGGAVIGLQKGGLLRIDETGSVMGTLTAQRLHDEARGVRDVVTVSPDRCVALVQASSGEVVVRVDWASDSVEPTNAAPLPARSIDRLRLRLASHGEPEVLVVGPQRVADLAGTVLLDVGHLARASVRDVTAHDRTVVALDSYGRLHQLGGTPAVVAPLENAGYDAALALADGTVLAADEGGRVWRLALAHGTPRNAPSVSEPALAARPLTITPFRPGEVLAIDVNGGVALLGVQDGGLQILRRDRLSHHPRLVRPAVEPSRALLLTSAATRLEIRAWDVDRLEQRRREFLTRHDALALVSIPSERDPAVAVMFGRHVELVADHGRRFLGRWEAGANSALRSVVALDEGRVAVRDAAGGVICLRAGADGLTVEGDQPRDDCRADALAANGRGTAIFAVPVDESGSKHAIRLLADGRLIGEATGATPLLAVSPRRLRAWAAGREVFVDTGVGEPVRLSAPKRVTALAWCGEQVVFATEDRDLHLIAPRRDGWQARRLISFPAPVLDLVGIGPLATLARTTNNRLLLVPLDEPTDASELPEQDVPAVAAAPADDDAGQRWLVVSGRHPEQLTWREIRSAR